LSQAQKKRQCDQQEGGQSCKGAEKSIDEFNPRVKRIEMGVIVTRVVLPQAAVSIRFKRSTRKVICW